MSTQPRHVKVLPSRLTPENRATVPAAARAALGAKPGDRLLSLVGDDDEVRVVRAAGLVHRLWANNHGGDAGDSAEDVRTGRDQDLWATADSGRFEPVEEDSRTDEEVAADLLAGLGPRT